MLTELQYRQRELDKKIQRYIDGWYDEYYTDCEGKVIVFVKDYKHHVNKNCVNVDGLILMLPIRIL